MRISASTARLQRRVHLDGHKPSIDVQTIMPAVDDSKVNGVEEALRCAKSASLVSPVCHLSLIDHPIWKLFGHHPAPHAVVGSQDHGEGPSTLTGARPKSEITV